MRKNKVSILIITVIALLALISQLSYSANAAVPLSLLPDVTGKAQPFTINELHEGSSFVEGTITYKEATAKDTFYFYVNGELVSYGSFVDTKLKNFKSDKAITVQGGDFVAVVADHYFKKAKKINGVNHYSETLGTVQTNVKSFIHLDTVYAGSAMFSGIASYVNPTANDMFTFYINGQPRSYGYFVDNSLSKFQAIELTRSITLKKGDIIKVEAGRYISEPSLGGALMFQNVSSVTTIVQ